MWRGALVGLSALLAAAAVLAGCGGGGGTSPASTSSQGAAPTGTTASGSTSGSTGSTPGTTGSTPAAPRQRAKPAGGSAQPSAPTAPPSAAELIQATRQSPKVAAGTKFTVSEIRSSGPWAAAALSSPTAGHATAVYRKGGGGWTLVDIGTEGVGCKIGLSASTEQALGLHC